MIQAVLFSSSTSRSTTSIRRAVLHTGDHPIRARRPSCLGPTTLGPADITTSGLLNLHSITTVHPLSSSHKSLSTYSVALMVQSIPLPHSSRPRKHSFTATPLWYPPITPVLLPSDPLSGFHIGGEERGWI